MLEVGNAGLTPDECCTHMTLWCMLNAPLLIGCDMSKMDPFKVSLFSNDEVIAVNQDALGKQAHRIKTEGTTEVWVKPLVDGTMAVAFFNRGDQPTEISLPWEEFEDAETMVLRTLSSLPRWRDRWRQKDLPYGTDPKVTVAPLGAELLRIGTPAQIITEP